MCVLHSYTSLFPSAWTQQLNVSFAVETFNEFCVFGFSPLEKRLEKVHFDNVKKVG